MSTDLDIFKVGTWPTVVYRVKHADGSVTRFSQSAYVDEGSYGPVVVEAGNIEVFVDHDVNVRCGGKLDTRWIRRFYEQE
ncbi:hypothetical protein GCM10028801_31220 [Nocardioides maradonensis]